MIVIESISWYIVGVLSSYYTTWATFSFILHYSTLLVVLLYITFCLHYNTVLFTLQCCFIYTAILLYLHYITFCSHNLFYLHHITFYLHFITFVYTTILFYLHYNIFSLHYNTFFIYTTILCYLHYIPFCLHNLFYTTLQFCSHYITYFIYTTLLFCLHYITLLRRLFHHAHYGHAEVVAQAVVQNQPEEDGHACLQTVREEQTWGKRQYYRYSKTLWS